MLLAEFICTVPTELIKNGDILSADCAIGIPTGKSAATKSSEPTVLLSPKTLVGNGQSFKTLSKLFC